ncbi:MAG: hypothetical protein DK306_000966 [Chloroflexi bacterium]|nr:MAG: hypothetical protein DK306_000966 [Chloroflexota bacterium]
MRHLRRPLGITTLPRPHPDVHRPSLTLPGRAPLAAVAISLAFGALMLLGAAASAQAPPTPITPSPEITTVRLFSGWNNVVYTGVALPVPDALTTVAPDVPVVWQFDAPSQRWNVWAANAPTATHTLTHLQPGGLYFLRATRTSVWIPRVTAPLAPSPDQQASPQDDRQDATASPAATPGVWQITMTRTTPLFTLQDMLHIDGDGNVLVDSLATPARLIPLPNAEIAALAATLEANDFLRGQPGDARSGCVSCFHYALTITPPQGDSRTILTDDVALSGGLLAVVERLVATLLSGLS